MSQVVKVNPGKAQQHTQAGAVGAGCCAKVDDAGGIYWI